MTTGCLGRSPRWRATMPRRAVSFPPLPKMVRFCTQEKRSFCQIKKVDAGRSSDMLQSYSTAISSIVAYTSCTDINTQI